MATTDLEKGRYNQSKQKHLFSRFSDQESVDAEGGRGSPPVVNGVLSPHSSNANELSKYTFGHIASSR